MFKRIPQEIWQQVFERLQNSLKYRLISRTFTDIDVSDALPPVAGTALADMALVPAANRRGDAVGFADVALDLTFGGLCGGGFGTASGLLHNRRVAGLAGEQSRLAELLGEAGYESADAGRLAASAIAHIADMPRRKDLSDAVRRNLACMDRLGAGKLLDRMMIAIRDGENPDVGKWAAELGMKGHFKPGKMVDLEPDIQSGVPVWSAQMPWNELLTVSKNWYDKNLAGSRVTVNWDNGTESLHGDIIFRATDQGMGKLRSNAHPDKLRLIPFLKTLLEKAEYLGTEMPRRLKHSRQGMLIHKARSFVRLDNKLLGVELTIRQDSNGRLFYDHFVFDYPRISGKKKKFPPESSEGAVGPNESRGGTGKVVTTTASDQQPALDTGLTARGTSITERSGKVNQLADTFAISNMRLTDHTPDFTAPAPEPKSMPHALDRATRADAKMFDAEEFGALDMDVSRIAEEGRMTPEYAAREGNNAPDAYASLLLAWAQRREAHSGVPVVESLRRFRVRAGRGDGPGSRPEGFFQPLNEGVDWMHLSGR